MQITSNLSTSTLVAHQRPRLLLLAVVLFCLAEPVFAGFSFGYGFPGISIGHGHYGHYGHYRGGHFGYHQPFASPRLYRRHAHPWHGYRSYSHRPYRQYRPRRFHRPHRYHRYRRY